MFTAIYLKAGIGIGDAIQFTSLPENYFYATGRKLKEISRHWVFDHNPYIERERVTRYSPKDDWIDLWDAYLKISVPRVFSSNAEVIASILDVPAILTRPRLYRFENQQSGLHTLLHRKGISHPHPLPEHVIKHILAKKADLRFFREIGLDGERDTRFHWIDTPTPWDLALTISRADTLYCTDSGPSWIAACYPKVKIKKIHPGTHEISTRRPLDGRDHVTFFYDQTLFDFYNTTPEDIGFTKSYLKL